MDPVTIGLLASSAVTLITTALSKTGETFVGKVNEEVATALGKSVGEKIAAVFSKIANKSKEKQAAAEAVQDVVADPKDEDAQATLRNQLKKLMTSDEAFAAEIERLLQEAKPEAEHNGINIVVSGSGSAAVSGGVAAGQGGIAVGGNVEGGVGIPRSPEAK